jgi:hypothetical protein
MAKAKPKNRGGRPRKSQIQAGEKTTISVRISPEVRKELEKAIAKNGRSLTQEAEIRIERSFFEDVLNSTYVNLFRLYQLETFRAIKTALTQGEMRDRHAAVEKLITEMEGDFKESRLQALDELEDGENKSLKQMDEELP